MKNTCINNQALVTDNDINNVMGTLGAIAITKTLFNGFKNIFNKQDTLEEELKDLRITEIKINRYKNRAAVYDNLIKKYNVTKPSNVLSVDFMNLLINKSLDSYDSLLHHLELKQIILNNIEILKNKK